MKKNLCVFIAILCAAGLSACLSSAPIDAAHNSRNSLNWEGVYAGTIPAASSPGINVQLTLNEDETYQISYQYIDRAGGIFTENGKFTWDKTGNIITLKTSDFPPYYQVGENRLTQLDMSGKAITGSLADNYVLRKESTTLF